MSAAKKAAEKAKYAYTSYPDEGAWCIALIERDVKGYRPVPEYGPYDDEKKAEGVANRLNERIGVNEQEELEILATTLPPLEN